jgi:hypothetical protein
MRESRILIVALCVAVSFLPALIKADDPPADRAMKGLTGVFVLIEHLDIGTGKIGLTIEEIQTDVELKLRLAGMRVLTKEQISVGDAVLYVNVNIMDDATAAAISVDLDQDVVLYRDKTIFLPNAKTWGRETLLVNPSRSGTRNAIKDQTDRFLNTWLAANPRSR